MAEEILINVTPRETRVAVIENGVLEELHVERSSRQGLVGNIYCGKVVRVLPGMQAAFVEIGLERAAFLHALDMQCPVSSEEDTGAGLQVIEPECITKLLQTGQSIIVQVIKDPIGTKGARLSTRLSLAARYLVLVPELGHVGVSTRIEDEAERERLKSLVTDLDTFKTSGYIVRTVAEGVSAVEIEQNKLYLHRLWGLIQAKKAKARFGEVIHEELPLALRALRDIVNIDTKRVRIDCSDYYQKAVDFSKEFIPDLDFSLECYENTRPIFDLYGIEEELQKALQRKVSLKSGGYVVFDHTEAMTTVDVNTGAFVGHRNLEETIFKTNLEASQTIAGQLRLRNIGGIIIIDFIDMLKEEHKEQVLRSFAKELERDNSKNNISEVSNIGLVEMTRKRTRESLQQIFCETCPTCLGRGAIKTAETIANEIFREIMRTAKAYDPKGFLVLAAQTVVDRMMDESSSSLAELMEALGKNINFQVEGMYVQEQFDVVLL